MSIRLSLISHASTRAVRTAAFPQDEPLDAFGVAAAEAVAGKGNWQADQCWCAPERRTRQTAAALGLAAEIEPQLADCNYGRWSGSSLAQIQQTEPDALAAWLTDPAAAPHGGESLLDLLLRAGSWLDGLQPAAAGKGGSTQVLAIAHPAVVRAVLVHALGAPPRSFWRLDVPPLSRAELLQRGQQWSIRSMSRL